MADLAMELEHLADAERGIQKLEARIAALEETASGIPPGHVEVASSETLLTVMRDTLLTFKEQRRLILETIEDIRAGRR